MNDSLLPVKKIDMPESLRPCRALPVEINFVAGVREFQQKEK
jgi:hypothetical protein